MASKTVKVENVLIFFLSQFEYLLYCGYSCTMFI